jgi:hypothetical protein
MNQKSNQSINRTQADARLQQWRALHNTPAKVAAAHRKVLLERVSQSMAFENQPVSMDRLKILTAALKARSANILFFIQKGRASGDHRFIVGALRAQRPHQVPRPPF